MAFQRATVKPFWLRLALDGPAGSGKTWTALEVGTFFAKQYGQVPAYIDTERGSASKYAKHFEFDVVEMKPPFHPERFVKGIAMAVEEGYKVLVIDSLSHAWNGPGGLLEIVDQIASRLHGNSYAAWKDATPIQTRLIDALTGADCHIIACMRAKMEYTQEKDERGRTQITKVGLAPVQREGSEYEFDVVGDINVLHNLSVTKTRCAELTDQMFVKPGKDFAKVLWTWTQSGVTREQLNAQLEAEQAAKAAAAAGTNGTATGVATTGGENGTGAGSAESPFPGDALRSADAPLRVSPLAGLVTLADESVVYEHADAPVEQALRLGLSQAAAGSLPGTPDVPPPWMTEDDPPPPSAELRLHADPNVDTPPVTRDGLGWPNPDGERSAGSVPGKPHIPPADNSGIPVETTYTTQASAPTTPPAQINAGGTTRVVVESREQFEDHIAGVLAEQGMPLEKGQAAEQPSLLPAGNGKKKSSGGTAASIASEVTKDFGAMCAVMVADCPYYRNPQGGADMFRILRAIKAEGIAVVNRQTIHEAIAKVTARGLRHQAEEEQKRAAKVEVAA